MYLKVNMAAYVPPFELEMPLLAPTHPPHTPRKPESCKNAQARRGAVTNNMHYMVGM